jgi:hypothetical protein
MSEPVIPADRPRCTRCGGRDITARWQHLRDGRRAIRADCARCRRYVKYLPQTQANVALADVEGGDHA